MNHPQALIVMAREPRPGWVKTRLAVGVGEERAAEWYRASLLDVLEASARVAGVDFLVCATPPESVPWFEQQEACGGAGVVPQRGAGLAERMAAAFEDTFAAGYDAVVVRNSDSPHLPEQRVQEAFAALKAGAEVALGGDEGGGYYLVGLREPHPELFLGVEMGGSSVYDETVRRAIRKGWALEELDPWPDVDRAEDLDTLRCYLERNPRSRAICPRTSALLGLVAEP